MTDRELMQQALEALEGWANHGEWVWPESALEQAKRNTTESIAALRERLAQPEQEPVAWITDGGKGELWWYQSSKFDEEGNLIGENPDDIPLYEAPPMRQWQGLTDEDVEEVEQWVEFKEEGSGRIPTEKLIRYIEAKLKEKNNG